MNPVEPIILIRPEQPALVPAIEAVQRAAFGRAAEAELIEKLRGSPQFDPKFSLMALYNGSVVGHALFFPVSMDGVALKLYALGPIGVLPDYQRQMIGSALIYEGLEVCRKAKVAAVFVVGDPAYYGRFGFVSAATYGITCEFDVPAGVFQAQELSSHVLAEVRGVVKYHPAFAEAT